MKKLKGIILGIVLFGAIVAGIIYWQANQAVEDPKNVVEEASYRTSDLLAMDEDMLNAMTGKNIAVSGIIWSNEGDASEQTIILGRDELNSVICQIDNRHLSTMSKLAKGQFVKIKGKLTGFDFDEMLGKTIQMKNCVNANIN